VFDVAGSHLLGTQLAWSGTMRSMDDVAIGFIVLMGGLLLCAFFVLGRWAQPAPVLGVRRRPFPPSREALATDIRSH
jgi:hypothetical protein